MIAYLSGPIENAENDGAEWREDITSWLDQNLKHNVFNPVLETKSILEHHDSRDFRSMKITEPLAYKRIIRKIIKLDLNAVVYNSDYLIVKWDKSVLKGNFYDLIRGDISINKAIVKTKIPNLFIIPTSMDLAVIEQEFVNLNK